MSPFQESRGIIRYLRQIVLALSIWSFGSQPAPAETNDRGQAELLADLSAQIISCSTHPCLGDEAGVELVDKFVTDGLFYYSNINDLYPQTDGILRGLVEWDSDHGSVGAIYFKILDFHSAPEILIHELQRALRSCQMDQDDDAGNEWSCLDESYSDDGLLIEVYFGPGLVLLELS